MHTRLLPSPAIPSSRNFQFCANWLDEGWTLGAWDGHLMWELEEREENYFLVTRQQDWSLEPKTTHSTYCLALSPLHSRYQRAQKWPCAKLWAVPLSVLRGDWKIDIVILWTDHFLPKFVCWSPSLQCDGIWSGAFQGWLASDEVMRGGALMIGLVPF